MPKTREELFAFLDDLGIVHKTHEHAPVFTVDESASLRDDIPGGHTKNLFLKDKKDNFFLITLEERANIDLKKIHTLIGAKSRVSFGKPEKLMEYLGVTPGSVTAFAAINDVDQNVTVILDKDLMDFDQINCHPLKNDATTTIDRDDLIKFLKECGHEPLILKLSQ